MRYFLLLSVVLFCAASDLVAQVLTLGKHSTYTIGNARFTALTSRLIRMEWSPDGKFEDRRSIAFVDRTPTSEFDVTQDPTKWGEEWYHLQTPDLTIRYIDDGTPFVPRNLRITQTFKHNSKESEWWAGKEDTGNLLGTFRTLDGVNGATQLEKGILSRDGWAIVDDSGKPVFEKLDGRQWFAERKDANALDWYYFGYGHDYKQALGDFTKFAGKIPLPPRFVFGAWWSRYWAYSDAELRELVAEFKANDVPLDVLVIDMDWHLDGWTGYTWNPKYFPDPEGFLKWAHEQGLKVTLNLHPADGVGKHEKAFLEVCKAMGLDPEKTEKIPFDCTDPKFVDAYFKFLHHPLEKMGIDFWWMDWQQGSDTKIKNLDPLMALNHLHWQDMANRAEETGKRPLIFSRWGGLGNHRYQIGFSGDTFCNWPSLAFQPYFTATAGNVGYAYWSHDIGGHQPGPVDPELYVRWIQWGALSPILRTHTTKNPLAERRIWKFPKEYFEAARKAYQFRYELIPYIYTMARKCHDTGIPLCRPLYYEWPEMDEAYTWKNEYMFGDDLLVSPVVEPADPISGCAMVEVWLPPGKWVNWFTGRQYEGPATIPLIVPLDEIPIFARAGAIIPTSMRHLDYDLANVDNGYDFSAVTAVKDARLGFAEAPVLLNLIPGEHGVAYLCQDSNREYEVPDHSKNLLTITNESVNGFKHLDLNYSPESTHGLAQLANYIRLAEVDPLLIRRIKVNGRSCFPQNVNDSEKPKTGFFFNEMTGEQLLQVISKPDQNPVKISFKEFVYGGADIRNGHRQLKDIKRITTELLAHSISDPIEKIGSQAASAAGASGYVAPQPETTKRICDDWEDLANRLNKANLSEEEKRRALIWLFQLHYQLTTLPRNNGTLEANLSICSTLNEPVAQGVTVTMRLVAPSGWATSDTQTRELSSIPILDPARLHVQFQPDTKRHEDPNENYLLPSSLLEGNIDLTFGNTRFEIPLHRILYPSINGWRIAGPYPAGPLETSLDKQFPPEVEFGISSNQSQGDAEVIEWHTIQRIASETSDPTSEFFVDFDDVFGRRVYDSVAYAHVFIDSEIETEAELRFGSDDGIAIWFNKQRVFRYNRGRPFTSKEDHAPVHVHKGENSMLVKINQGGGDWGFCVHLESPDGKPLTQVRTRTTPLAK